MNGIVDANFYSFHNLFATLHHDLRYGVMLSRIVVHNLFDSLFLLKMNFYDVLILNDEFLSFKQLCTAPAPSNEILIWKCDNTRIFAHAHDNVKIWTYLQILIVGVTKIMYKWILDSVFYFSGCVIRIPLCREMSLRKMVKLILLFQAKFWIHLLNGPKNLVMFGFRKINCWWSEITRYRINVDVVFR